MTPHHLIWQGTSTVASDLIAEEISQEEQNSEDTPLKSFSSKTADEAGESTEIWIAHSLFAAIDHLPNRPKATILIRLITFVTYTLSFSSPRHLELFWDSLKALLWSRKPGDKESLYAFAFASKNPPIIVSKQQDPSILPGWQSYNPIEEFMRMKIISDPSGISQATAWRLSNKNSNFDFCPTYPTPLLIPSKISDTTLTYAVKYRSKGRLPVGTYVHWANGSSITRSSQPMVGFKNARSIQDEKLIEMIFNSHSLHTGPRGSSNQTPTQPAGKQAQQIVYGATSSNLIIDARPTTNAVANTVMGAGTENMEYYKGCRKAYLGIDNIHVMRDSLNKIVAAIHESYINSSPVSTEALRKSGWLKHISAILEGTSIIIRTVHVYNSHVLIHCSDGWDRTSQLSALSQVCLDPNYRTFSGFATLVEKDWLSFGHKFSDRSGIVIPGKERVNFGEFPTHSNLENGSFGNDDSDLAVGSTGAWVASFQKQLNFSSSVSYSHSYKESSPVFHQFLDCVYQLQRQYPQRFEFNGRYLERLHEELHAGTYGTFLFNCEKERVEAKASSRTRSVWELFPPLREVSEYRNPQYNSSLDDSSNRKNEDQGVLFPDVKDVVFWWELFGCDNEAMNSPKDPADVPFI
ncbi:protein-tyrosine phosphatase-like protein [Phakopsora pachyrhizi]|nr:protein-tyrosine phosphatase-like protein [Phakopsora pachyrhizi]